MSKLLKKGILLAIITLGFLLLSQTCVNAATIDSSETLKKVFEGKSAIIEGKTITLTGNVEFKNPNWAENSEDEYYDVIELEGDDYVLNLDGYTFNVYELNINDGSLTINDSWSGTGTFKTYAEYSGINIFSDAELIINRGNIEAPIINQGTLNINDGVFRKFIQNFYDYDYENNVLNSLGKLNIEKGNFSGIGQEGIAIINGGVFKDTAGFTPLTISLYEENNGAKTTIKGGEFITSNPEEYDAIAIFNNAVSLKEDEINKYIADGYVATYDKATIVEDGASPYISYTSRVKVSSQKILDFLDKIAPNGVWTVNSYKPTYIEDGMTVLTASLKEALAKEKIDSSIVEEVYAMYDTSPEEGIIQLGSYGTGTEEIRKVKVVYNEPDKNSNKIVNEFLTKMDKLNLDDIDTKTAYKVEDLYLINYLYNAKNGVDGSMALNFSKELIKAANGSNIYFRFYGGFGEGDSTRLYTFEGGQAAVLHKGTIYDSINAGVTLNHVLYIPANTKNSTDAYINAAMKRIKDYLGTTEGIEIEIGSTFESLNEYYDSGMTHWNKNGFIDEKTCGSYYYNITINKEIYRFAICKKDAKDLETPEYLASDIMSNICIKSNSTEVPLDTAISVEKITSDEIEKALGTKVYVAFDISLYSKAKDASIKRIKNDNFIVSIPVPKTFEDEQLITVYYIDNKGNKTEHKATVKDGFASFETNHFSTYALVEKIDNTNSNDGNTSGDKNPETNDNNNIDMGNTNINSNDNTNTSTDKNNNTVNSDNPKTGDNIMVFIAIFGISLLGILLTLKVRKTKNK